MKRFCTNCGKELAEGAIFCVGCGVRANGNGNGDGPSLTNQQVPPPPQQPSYTAVPPPQQPSYTTVPPPQQPSYTAVPPPPQQPYQAQAYQPYTGYPGAKVKHAKKHRPYLIIGVLVLVLALLGAGVWKAGEMTGIWQRMAVDREFNAWKKQKDLKAEEKAIMAVIDAMRAKLQAGDNEGALAYIHPDRRDIIKSRFNENQDKLGLLVSLMNDCELTYLSTDTGNYEALRMATVQAGIPTPGAGAGMPDTGTVMFVMVKSESGWVVEDIS